MMPAPRRPEIRAAGSNLLYVKDLTYMTDFKSLNLAQPILKALEAEGYTQPTPIQDKAIPPLLDGRDLLGVAQTGTGKTAAFALPMLHRLADAGAKALPRQPLALILAPTRELAGQIDASLKTYGRNLNLRTAVVFGGVSLRPQIGNLAKGVHILVATPGRLLDLMNQRHVDLSRIQVFVLDEADRMLDMGFIRDVKKVTAVLPKQRQTLLFSATMPETVQSLADGLLTDPVRVEVAPQATTAERVKQRLLFVTKDDKRALLGELLNDDSIARVLIFTRTKHGADRVAKHLHASGVSSDAIHGNKSQNARERALKGFRSGHVRALVATDIAARGIDVDGVTHVINFDLPVDPESYVHRIGRTARAGNSGMAISFCAHDERDALRDIERTIRQQVPVFEDHPYHAAGVANDRGAAQDRATSNRGGQHHRGPNRDGQNRNGKGQGNRRRGQRRAA